MENTKPNKKLYIVVEVILFAVYILIGVLLFVTEKHCAADAFILLDRTCDRSSMCSSAGNP